MTVLLHAGGDGRRKKKDHALRQPEGRKEAILRGRVCRDADERMVEAQIPYLKRGDEGRPPRNSYPMADMRDDHFFQRAGDHAKRDV